MKTNKRFNKLEYNLTKKFDTFDQRVSNIENKMITVENKLNKQ